MHLFDFLILLFDLLIVLSSFRRGHSKILRLQQLRYVYMIEKIFVSTFSCSHKSNQMYFNLGYKVLMLRYGYETLIKRCVSRTDVYRCE